jgi:hypothetical protein
MKSQLRNDDHTPETGVVAFIARARNVGADYFPQARLALRLAGINLYSWAE